MKGKGFCYCLDGQKHLLTNNNRMNLYIGSSVNNKITLFAQDEMLGGAGGVGLVVDYCPLCGRRRDEM